MDDNLKIGLKIALQRFAEESNRREALDTKAALVLGFAGVLAGLLFNILSTTLSQQSLISTRLAIFLPLILGCVAVLFSAFFSLAALWIRGYRGGPGSKILLHASEAKPDSDLERQLLTAYANTFQHNWEQNQRKVVFLYAGFSAIAVGTLLVFVALVLSVII
jgi:hypothetical protein